jgi:hypothetical protein
MSSRYSGGVVRKNQLVPTTSSASGVWNLGEATQATKADIWPYANIAMPISQSLRFRASNSNYLNRTQGTSTNQNIGTWSFWFKRGTLGTVQRLFEGYTASSDTGVMEFEFATDDCFYVGGWATNWRITTQVFRDPAAWYHFVVVVDTTQSTANNRIRVYVNGTEITSFSTTNNPTQNSTFGLSNNSAVLQIGRRWNVVSNDSFVNGYMTDINFIDGQALTPSSFGQTSAITGVWEPKQYTGTYGTNGYHLEFKDNTIGHDTSGNNNDYTPINFSTANDSTLDLMEDVPTQWAPRGVTDVGGTVRGNYAVLNPLWKGANITPTDGNLTNPLNNGSPNVALSTMPMSTGKWYAEMTNTAAYGDVGLCIVAANLTAPTFTIGVTTQTGLWEAYDNGGGIYVTSDGSSFTSSLGASRFRPAGTIQFAYDADNGYFWIGRNNTWYDSSWGTTGNPATGANPTFTISSSRGPFNIGAGSNTATNAQYWNFGQRPFTYAPPSGFKSLCTTNLPTPTIGATTATAANKYFDATLYTGTGATLSVTNAGGFQPDFVWLKSRSAATNHQAFDTVRGATKVSVINAAEAESTSANTITSFNSNGFTVGTNTAINTSSATYVAWQWWAGGSTVTNTTGSISAQVRASTTTGFSIATYTGNGTGGATIGHGLGAAPSMLIFRNRDAADNSALVWHTGFNTNQGQVLLSSTAAVYNPGNGLYFNSTTPGSSVVTLGTSGGTNGSGSNMIMYAWTPIAGFSAFGSYTGNGVADGPFVYLGFRPRYFIFKNITSTQSWSVQDTSRSPFNVGSAVLLPNSTTAELTGTDFIDIVSNGFKIRHSSSGNNNNSGDTYIYAAFAEHPFKNSLAR